MQIVSIALSKKKGTVKTCVTEALLIENHGLEGDAHAGAWHRQVSFLADESISRVRTALPDIGHGDFAENIATTGIDWKTQKIGLKVRIGQSALVRITQIGKKCHSKCQIFYRTGDCIMPKEGVFAEVLKGGTIRVGDRLRLEDG